MLKRILGWIAAALLVAVVLVLVAYFTEMNRHYARVRGKTAVIPSAFGEIEYVEGGEGPPVLVIHGSGGGFDQGKWIIDLLLDDSFHWIAPSRFGYLRSTFNEGATFDDQAHAYAALLDHLGIDEVAVVTLSHGGPSALLFAVLYPERVSSLTLVSAGVAPAVTADQGQANQKGSMLTTIYQYDWLYWGMTKLFRKQFMELMGATETVIAGLTPEQLVMADRVIDEMNPVSPRSAGVLFDNRAALPGERIEAIQAPTLILHAADDTLQLFHNAEFAAAHIPSARLERYERGGHVLIAVEQEALRAAVQQHIRGNAGE